MKKKLLTGAIVLGSFLCLVSSASAAVVVQQTTHNDFSGDSWSNGDVQPIGNGLSGDTVTDIQLYGYTNADVTPWNVSIVTCPTAACTSGLSVVATGAAQTPSPSGTDNVSVDVPIAYTFSTNYYGIKYTGSSSDRIDGNNAGGGFGQFTQGSTPDNRLVNAYFVVNGTTGGGGGGAPATGPAEIFAPYFNSASTTFNVVDYPNEDLFFGFLLFYLSMSFIIWVFRKRS